MICYVIYGVNIYASKHKFNSFEEKNAWYSNDFGWFFATRIRFIEADPDPTDQNETDPNGSGSATLAHNFYFDRAWFSYSRLEIELYEKIVPEFRLWLPTIYNKNCLHTWKSKSKYLTLTMNVLET